MEQRLHIGPPEPGSDREKEFNNGLQQIQSRLQNAVDRRRNREEKNDIPFIDALLQSGVLDEQVIIPCLMYAHTYVYFYVRYVMYPCDFKVYIIIVCMETPNIFNILHATVNDISLCLY